MIFPTSQWPTSTQAKSTFTSGAGTTCQQLLATSTTQRTILYTQISANSGDNIQLQAGTSTLLANNASPFLFSPIPIHTSSSINCTRSSGGVSQILIAYVDYDTRTDTSTVITDTNILNQPIATTITGAQSDPWSSTTVNFTQQNTGWLVVIGIVLASFLGYDLLRRLFSTKKR